MQILATAGWASGGAGRRAHPAREPERCLILHPSTLTPQPCALHPAPAPCTLNPQPSTLNPQPSTLNPQARATASTQRWSTTRSSSAKPPRARSQRWACPSRWGGRTRRSRPGSATPRPRAARSSLNPNPSTLIPQVPQISPLNPNPWTLSPQVLAADPASKDGYYLLDPAGDGGDYRRVWCTLHPTPETRYPQRAPCPRTRCHRGLARGVSKP